MLEVRRKAEAHVARHSIRPLGCPDAVDPAAWRKALIRRIEWRLQVIDRLLAVLDAMDGDADLEDSGDAEPSLGWATAGQSLRDGDIGDDREVDNADYEPTLGAPERPASVCGRPRDRNSSQTLWANGSTRDGEYEAVNQDGDPDETAV